MIKNTTFRNPKQAPRTAVGNQKTPRGTPQRQLQEHPIDSTDFPLYHHFAVGGSLNSYDKLHDLLHDWYGGGSLASATTSRQLCEICTTDIPTLQAALSDAQTTRHKTDLDEHGTWI